jgi:IclR family KDG regulon transcriptional repressor
LPDANSGGALAVRRAVAVRAPYRSDRMALPTTLEGAQTIGRVTALLDLYAQNRPSLSVSEAAAELGLPRSTAHRMLAALRLSGYLRQDERTGRYLLGARVLYLAQVYGGSQDLRAIARPHMESLLERVNESVSLYVREGEHRYPVERIESSHEMRIVVALGQRLPLGKGSAGKVLSMTAAAAAEAGAVMTRGERVPNAWGIAAGVFDGSGQLVAAVEISGPLDRMTPAKAKRYSSAVHACADAISRDLGHR